MKFLLGLALLLPLAASAAGPAKVLVMLGDSLTEGYGVAKEKAYPALLEKKLHAAGKSEWKVINSGVSGSTSASAPSRLQWALKSKPDAVFIALGANDGLRGIKPAATKENLLKTIKAAREKNVRVFVAGMEMPPNYGEEYRAGFRKIFSEVAKAEKTEFMPFLLKDVGGIPSLNLDDGIHPNEAGHEKVAENVFAFLKGKL
ncbi:MAG: arylesterase [Proteobacteria bacterium]|nr:MAG: arylesterase [Pseudomonadota bacterium]